MKYDDAVGSLYAGVKDMHPTMVIIRDFLTDQSCKNDIERYRECTDPEEKAAMKRKFNAIVISGICDGSRANFRNHNGLICIDIDSKDNPHIEDWPSFVFYLKSIMTNAWFCGLSVSGKGCFLVIGILYPARHEDHFRSIQRYFYKELGIVVDGACADRARLRFQSYNTLETSWLNDSAKGWRYIVKGKRYEAPVAEPLEATETINRIEACIKTIVESGIDITDGNDWVRVGCALINELGESGRAYFHQVSQFHKDYTVGEADRKYSYWQRRTYPYTIRTFFYLCRQYGILQNIDNQ